MNKAKDGYVFAKKDKSEIYGNLICIGKNDSIDNYIQITISEAEELKNKNKEELDTETEVE